MTVWEFTDHLGSVASLAGLPLTIAGLFVGASGLRSSSMSRKIVLSVLVGLALLAYGFDVYDRFFTDHSYKYQFGADKQLEEVRDREFRNETVAIDGKRFIRCKFNNVTIIYDGMGKFEFVGTVPTGQIVLKSNNPSIQYMIFLMRANNLIGSNVGIFNPEAVPK